MTMNENRVVLHKHRAIIQMTNVKAIQRKAYNIMLKTAYDQKDSDRYSVQLSELKHIAGIKDTSNKNVKESIVELMRTIVQMDIINGSPDHWRAVPLLGEVEIKEGIVYFDLPRTIREAILNPDRYATIDLMIVKGLRSKYAIALYELARDYYRKEIPKMSVNEFRQLMGVEDNKYKNFADLKRSVIDRAIDEINSSEKINFGLRVEPIKGHGRAIKELKFHIIRNKSKGTAELPIDAHIISGTSHQIEFNDPKKFREYVVDKYRGDKEHPLCNRVPGWLPNVKFAVSKAGYLCRVDTGEDISGDDAKKIWSWLFENQDRVGTVDKIDELEELELSMRGNHTKISMRNALGTIEEIKFYPESIEENEDGTYSIHGNDEFGKTGKITIDTKEQLKQFTGGLDD